MGVYIYDFECLKYDWMVVIKDTNTGQYTKIVNDNDALIQFVDNTDPIMCGFNSKRYDQFILKGVLAGWTPEQIHGINDWIIGGNEGWDYEPLKSVRVPYTTQIDVMDDMQIGQSLKSIEGHLYMDIRETETDFNIDRHLTDDEIERMLYYCTHDVDATEEIFKLRKGYFQTKLDIAALAGIDDRKAISATNAKLTALMLKAEAPGIPWRDEREYVIPENLKQEYIPKEVMDFFSRVWDKSIPDSELWTSSLEIDVGGCPTKLAFGGIHGAIPTYREDCTEDRMICNVDVGSYYPNLMVNHNYISRNLPNPDIFKEVLSTRLKAKKAGDKKTANALKLIVNTCYGASKNGVDGVAYNALYDPKNARSICITGQLFLLELTENLIAHCQSLKVIQLNTDGLMYSIDKSDYDKAIEIQAEWQSCKNLTLEEDKIRSIIQKDVNNYIEIALDGTYKIKGGYLVRGISTAGAFKVNNEHTVVSDAVIKYLVDGVEPEVTICADNDIKHYQMIAKGGSKYKRVYTFDHDVEVPVQNCNRVYASKDKTKGTLYKVKRDDESVAKIAGLPEHCLIDNANDCTIDDIDKQWYIDLAHKQINDFLGIEPEKPKKERKRKMATEKKQNVYQKLAEARLLISEAGLKKSGKNQHMSFMYFELEDIVPTITKVFREIGLVSIVNFNSEQAILTLVNTDDPADCIVFSTPFNIGEPNKGVTVIQHNGSAQTYYRRYLHLLALDVVETDEINASIGKPDDSKPTAPVAPVIPAIKPKAAPATPAQREEIKKELTNGEADELQLKQLKDALVKLVQKDPSFKGDAKKMEEDTQGFTKCSRQYAEKMLVTISGLLEG